MITIKNLKTIATNLNCKDAISKGISEGYNYDRGHLNTDFLKPIIEKFGYIRTGTILANAIVGKKWDVRISKANMEWAEKWEYVIDEPYRGELLLGAHNPGLIDILIRKFRSLADKCYNPLPDTSVDSDDLYNYGYISNEGIYPLGEEKALELFDKNLPVLLLYTDDTEAYTISKETIKKHCENGGFCGIEEYVWVNDVLFAALDNQKEC